MIGAGRSDRRGAVDPRRAPRSATDCVIEDGAVLGKRPRLRPGSQRGRARLGARCVVGDDVTVCSGAVVYARRAIGAGAIIGDQSPGPRARGGRRAVGRRPRLDGRLRRARRRPGADPDRRVRDRPARSSRTTCSSVPAWSRPTTTRWAATPRGDAAARARCSGGPAGSAAASCSRPGSRSARRRSSPRARSSPATSARARS